MQRINECELVVQASKDCVNKLMKRLQVGCEGMGARERPALVGRRKVGARGCCTDTMEPSARHG